MAPTALKLVLYPCTAGLVAMVLVPEYGGWKVWCGEKEKTKRKQGGERKEGQQKRKNKLTQYR